MPPSPVIAATEAPSNAELPAASLGNRDDRDRIDEAYAAMDFETRLKTLQSLDSEDRDLREKQLELLKAMVPLSPEDRYPERRGFYDELTGTLLELLEAHAGLGSVESEAFCLRIQQAITGTLSHMNEAELVELADGAVEILKGGSRSLEQRSAFYPDVINTFVNALGGVTNEVVTAVVKEWIRSAKQLRGGGRWLRR